MMSKVPLFFNNFHSDKWTLLSDDNKVSLLQNAENYFAEKQGREARSVELEEMNDIYKCGYYSHTIPNKLYINKMHLDNDYADEGMNYQALNTVIHEGRHAYQDDVRNGKIMHNPQEAAIWEMNYDKNAYMTDKGDSYGEYRFQPIEEDANNYANEELDNLKNRYYVDDRVYKNYEEDRDYDDSLAKTEALALYGENYKGDIESRVKDKYYDYHQDEMKRREPIHDKQNGMKESILDHESGTKEKNLYFKDFNFSVENEDAQQTGHSDAQNEADNVDEIFANSDNKSSNADNNASNDDSNDDFEEQEPELTKDYGYGM